MFIYVQMLIVLQVFRQIFTSPVSALKPETAKKGRPSKARLHGLTGVTGRTIAYTCVIVSLYHSSHSNASCSSTKTRIALRGLGWGIDDGDFEYQVFYQNIVSMFEDNPEDDWVKETLAWWQEYGDIFFMHQINFYLLFSSTVRFLASLGALLRRPGEAKRILPVSKVAFWTRLPEQQRNVLRKRYFFFQFYFKWLVGVDGFQAAALALAASQPAPPIPTSETHLDPSTGTQDTTTLASDSDNDPLTDLDNEDILVPSHTHRSSSTPVPEQKRKAIRNTTKKAKKARNS